MSPDYTSVSDFVQYYRETFVPAYSDVTSYLLNKPEEVLQGMENISSHMIQYLDETKDTAVRQENLKKAFHHLERATLDCYKILWVRMETDLIEIIKDSELRKFCVNTTEGTFLENYNEFLNRVRAARAYELNNVGDEISVTVEYYKKVVESGNLLCSFIDKIKIQDYKETRKKWLKRITIKDILVGIIGAIAGAILWEIARDSGTISAIVTYIFQK
jgi:DNA-directed RNA polymerase subunit H (RpoH/RPB5)